jgi:hypothetical protein
MEFNKPPENLQMRFKEKPESIKVGGILRYVSEENGGYFVNQFGFKIDTIPVGARIKTGAFGFGLQAGVGMPDCEGLIFQKDGKTFFSMESGLNKKSIVPAKFFNGDNIEIISLPE